MECKLCNKEKTLIKKSHILPEFLFKKLFDPHHKLRKFDLVQMAKGNPRISRPSSGLYEGQILCQECDNKTLGQYESYIANLLNETLKESDKISCRRIRNEYGLIFTEIANINYKKTKLFLLSVLYRAHISSSPEFKQVNLGTYGEIIREIIYNDLDVDDLYFQISIMKFPKSSDYNSFIGQMIKRKIDGTTMYSIIINGYLILFFTKQNGVSKKIENIRLKEDGTISILEMPTNLVEKFILSYAGIK